MTSKNELIDEIKEIIKETQELVDTEKQRVVCAACKWPDGHVIIGIRHFSADMQLSAHLQGYSPRERTEEGFIDQWGNFLTRQEAFKIALRQRQYAPYKPFCVGTLYSEDLY